MDMAAAARLLPSVSIDLTRPTLLVAGLDVTYTSLSSSSPTSTADRDIAVACLVVQCLHPDGTSTIVHTELLETAAPALPYAPGLLGFREVPAYRELLAQFRATRPDLTPEVYLVDGFGVLHPRRCGAAVHIGLEAGVPTIGVAKHLLHIEGEGFPSEAAVRTVLRLQPQAAAQTAAAAAAEETLQLTVIEGADRWPGLAPEARAVELWARTRGPSSSSRAYGSGDLEPASDPELLGLAIVPTPDFERPFYVSAGAGVGLETAAAVALRCCRVEPGARGVRRYPEVLRLADQRAREYIRQKYGAGKYGRVQVDLDD